MGLAALPGGALLQQASRGNCLSSPEVTQSHGAGGLLASDVQAPKSVNSHFESSFPWLGVGLHFHAIKHVLTCLNPGWSSWGNLNASQAQQQWQNCSAKILLKNNVSLLA